MTADCDFFYKYVEQQRILEAKAIWNQDLLVKAPRIDEQKTLKKIDDFKKTTIRKATLPRKNIQKQRSNTRLVTAAIFTLATLKCKTFTPISFHLTNPRSK